MESYISILIVVLVGIFLLSRSLRVASEHERFAEIDVGRFTGFKGPGVVFKLSRGAEWLRVKVGDRGELLAPRVGRFGGHDLPVETTGVVEPQEFVRVTGFEGEGRDARLIVSPDRNQQREIECPKCGHIMEIK